MSLTLIARSAAFLLLGTLAAYGGWVWALPMARYVVAAQDSTQEDLRISNRVLAYRLGEDRPLRFVFSQPADEVRLRTHAAVGPAAPLVDGARYGLLVTLFDAQGEQIAQFSQSFLAGRVDGLLPDGRARRFYRAGDLQIWGGDQIVIANPQPFVSVEIALSHSEDLIEAIDLRAYERRPVMAGEERAIFLKRNAAERRALTAFSPFPADMLTEDELRNLARNLWRPVGPVGVEGRDYDAVVIYAAERGGVGAS